MRLTSIQIDEIVHQALLTVCIEEKAISLHVSAVLRFEGVLINNATLQSLEQIIVATVDLITWAPLQP